MELLVEKVLIRVIEALEKGIGAFAKPWQIRRTGKANAEVRAIELVQVAEAEKTVAEIRAGRMRLDGTDKLEKLSDNAPELIAGPNEPSSQDPLPGNETIVGSPADLVSLARDVALAEALEKSINLKRVALFAEEEAEKIDERRSSFSHLENEKSEVDDDWFSRWKSGAQDVRREEMQRLWGKLLAGEIAKPGSHSLHTVDFLSRMSTQDAELLEKIAPFATGGGLVKLSDNYFEDRGIRTKDFLQLSGFGLIGGYSGLGGLEFTMNAQKQDGPPHCVLRLHDKALLFEFLNGENWQDLKITYPVYSISKVGAEILSLGDFQPDFDFISDLSDHAFKQGCIRTLLGEYSPDNKLIVDIKLFKDAPARDG